MVEHRDAAMPGLLGDAFMLDYCDKVIQSLEEFTNAQELQGADISDIFSILSGQSGAPSM